ncbi:MULTISPECIES: ABC transporter ATP-binding protein [unclassified Oceanispirochaeta]|uniref:ABC transporter ATP-binding protein n=1 Tax=unclassified Oceanispirochaeta TaxID=2635722 RepID=UPI000E095278|nr:MULTISPECIES: ABC transporter ATP-binding protein [unclassified Oceanispirochaeta]MBF9016515.1 ABC transporter ATP-binding protein [Oceanispirochaeta sp. M2]NPD72977.1 ABC transporter ATP-binding protein [Oceanispirochaeta sp. M1]RDG31321.1 ABC transporter ATP-binding protein [Oceanispirochaeta sp. M1]
MLKYFQKKYAMSEKGAKDLYVSIIWTVVMDISFMIPVVLSFKFLNEYMISLINKAENPTNSILYYIIMSIGFLLLMFVIAYFQYDSAFTKIYEESARRRISLAETLRKLPLAFFGKKDVADLSSTIMEDATQIEQLFSHSVPQIYAAVMTTLIMGVMMFFYNWQLSLALFWVVPVSIFVFCLSRKFQNRMHIELYQVKRDISDEIQEGLDSAHEIKSYNREDDYSNSISSNLNNFEKSLIKGELLIGAFINLSYVFLKLGLPSVMLYGAYLLATGSINIFTYLVFLVVAARIYNPIMTALDNFAAIIYLNVRIKRMEEMEQMPRQNGTLVFDPENYDIEFNNVDFSYQEGVQTLKDVSFTAKQGEVTALVGPSGGGKSTVAKLSARFWDIDRGVITLGGEDISLVDPETLLNNFSIVFQDVTLFNSSVMDNIRLGKKDAADHEVMNAARLAQCDDFIKNLPQGYDTLIGENGEKLSGGERQRISIARAMLKDAPIILLDEATASLDAENESKIQGALSELIKNRTVLIIAHRMRTVSGADKIVVIKDGTIAESGTPLELNEKQGIFSSMLKTQYGVSLQ